MSRTGKPGFYCTQNPACIGHWRGVLGASYIEDRAERHRIDCEAKKRTLNFLYYAQEPMGLGQFRWSVAADEPYDSVAENGCSNIPGDLKPVERLLPVRP